MNINKAYERYNKLESNTTIQNYIAQANSRYILYVAKEPIERFPNYHRDLDERCLHIAFNYLSCGWYLFQNERVVRDASLSIEKSAEVLEYLYAYLECEKPYKDYYRLVCSLAYYVSAQYSKSFIILKNYESNTYISLITKLFLTKNFKELDNVLKQHFLNDNKSEISNEYIYERILSKAFVQLLHYIKIGDEDLISNAKIIVKDLIELSSSNNEPHMWWYFKLLYLVLGEFEVASLWNLIPPFLGDDFIASKYINANLHKKNPITELFLSQRESLNSELLEGKGYVVGMPTSSGKTKVAELNILKTLKEHPDKLCVYIAPYRSLANEIEKSLSTIFEVMGYQVSQLYGGFQSSTIDSRLIDNASVIIATPEKIKSMLRSNDTLKERLKLIIIDEGHLVGAEERYITSELLIEEIKVFIKRTQGKLLLLSAVLPNIQDFGLWVGEDINSNTKTTWRPASQRFGVLSYKDHSVNLEWQGEEPSFNTNFISKKPLITKRKTKKPKFYPRDKKEAVAETAVKLMDVGSTLIYVGRSNMVMSQSRAFLEIFIKNNIEHEWKSKKDWNLVELTCLEAYGEDSEIVKLLKKGIVPHSAKLPSEVRQSIEQLMTKDTPKIIVATSTLGQGVNIGVSTVIITNVWLDDRRTVKANDFWNIAGRAGRAFTDTEGKILYVIDRDKSQYSINSQLTFKDNYFDASKIEVATSGIYQILTYLYKQSLKFGIDYQLFLELIAENVSFETEDDKLKEFANITHNFFDYIDDTLISMNLFNKSYLLDNPSSWIDEAFRSSLAYIQANSNELSGDKVIDILKARNTGVLKIVGSHENWNSIAISSVPVRISLEIDKRLTEVYTLISRYINSELSLEELIDLVTILDDFVMSLPNTKSYGLQESEFCKIRYSWFKGDSVKEINSINKMAEKVQSEYYCFHFPWIINALAKKLKLQNENQVSELLELVALLAELGLSSMNSVNIYLAGIKSRACANELSLKIDSSSGDVKGLLEFFYERCVLEEDSCSELCLRWLENLMDEKEDSGSLKIIRKRFRTSEKIDYDRLFIKNYNGELMICSFDYEVRLPVKAEATELLKSYADREDIYVRKTGDKTWILETDNPYLQKEDE